MKVLLSKFIAAMRTPSSLRYVQSYREPVAIRPRHLSRFHATLRNCAAFHGHNGLRRLIAGARR